MPKRFVDVVLFGPWCLVLLIWQLSAPAVPRAQQCLANVRDHQDPAGPSLRQGGRSGLADVSPKGKTTYSRHPGYDCKSSFDAGRSLAIGSRRHWHRGHD